MAGDVRACGTGQFVHRQTAAVQPIADGPGPSVAPAAQCRGGGDAGVGDQPVDCPFAVGPLATTARRQPGSSRPGFIQHRGRIFFRLPVSRIIHPLGPQLRGGRLFAAGGGVFRPVGGAICVIWRSVDRAYSDPEHGGEHPADLLGAGGPPRHSRAVPGQPRRIRGDEPDLRRHLVVGAANGDLCRGAGVAVFLPKAHVAATGSTLARR